MKELIVYKNKKSYQDDCQGIYCINFDNGKKYIGLSSRVKKRLWQHYKSMENPKDILPVHLAMRKHNFTFELLENCDKKDRKFLCDREKYWIAYYGTYQNKEKGYNLTPGGDGASFGSNNSSAKLNEEQILEIYDKLINSKDLFIYQIANQYNISPTAIGEINSGKRYYNPYLNYPLRKFIKTNVKKGIENHLSIFSQNEIDNIYNDLLNSSKTLMEIAKENNCSYTTISKINRGLEYQKENYIYPIRKEKRKLKLSYEEIEEIYNLILNTKESLKSIAKKYNVSQDTIIRLNQGKTFKKEQYTYPLRANKEINKAVSTISESGE